MMLNSEQELRFQGSYRFSGIKDYVTIVSNREWSKTAAKVAKTHGTGYGISMSINRFLMCVADLPEVLQIIT